jgi:MoaA/NifB/PqqE/SkfB family radical SAM enzyme
MKALEVLKSTAPHGRRQVTVMTVVMNDNVDDLEDLLLLSAEAGVNHQCTLISTGGGGRTDRAQRAPVAGIGQRLLDLKKRHPHFISFTGYLDGIDSFLGGGVRTPCRAGERFLNVDHLGEVSPCIEKLHLRAGNLRREPWSVIAERLRGFEETRTCKDCWTSCRGFVEEMSGRPRLRPWREFFGGFASVTPAQRK